MDYTKDIVIYIIFFIAFYVTTVALIKFFTNHSKLKNPKPKRFPSVTIAVPVFNAENTIKKTLDSLLKLKYPKNKLKIVVVNDGSTDNTLKIAKSYESKCVIVYSKKNTGKSDSLNYAIKRCDTELFTCLDADCFVFPDALKQMVGYFENKKVMGVTGSIKIWKPKKIIEKIQLIEFLSSTFIRKVFAFLGGLPLAPGPFTIYRMSFFKRHGGYDTTTLAEDVEMALRVENKKYLIENAIDVNIYTSAVPKFKGVLMQRLRWFRGFIDNLVKYKHMFLSKKYGNLGIFVLPSSVLMILVSLFGVFYALYFLIKRIYNSFMLFRLYDYNIKHFLDFSWDPFFISITPPIILAAITIIVGIAVIYIAKIYSKERQKIKVPFLCFFLFYAYLYAFWWVLAICYKLTNKKILWGKKYL